MSTIAASLTNRTYESLTRANLVVRELAHEYVFVDRLNGVIQQPRQPGHVADLRAFPRHDGQRLGRILVAQDRDAGERLRVGGGLAISLRNLLGFLRRLLLRLVVGDDRAGGEQG